MDTVIGSYPRFERSGFASATLAISAILLAVGLAPRNERALFLRDDTGLKIKAFTAVVAPLDALRARLEKGAFDEVLASTRSLVRPVDPDTRRFADAGPPLLPGTLPALISNAPQPTGADAITGAGGAGNPSGIGDSPSGIAPPPTGGVPGNGAGGGGGVAPPGVLNPPTGGPGLAPLPEPSSWAMLLIGMFGIGGAIRRPSGLREWQRV